MIFFVEHNKIFWQEIIHNGPEHGPVHSQTVGQTPRPGKTQEDTSLPGPWRCSSLGTEYTYTLSRSSRKYFVHVRLRMCHRYSGNNSHCLDLSGDSKCLHWEEVTTSFTTSLTNWICHCLYFRKIRHLSCHVLKQSWISRCPLKNQPERNGIRKR